MLKLMYHCCTHILTLKIKWNNNMEKLKEKMNKNKIKIKSNRNISKKKNKRV